MTITRHAGIRAQQRGIIQEIIPIIYRHGRLLDQNESASRIRMDRREVQKVTEELKQMIQLIEKARDNIIVLSENNSVLTVYRER